MGRRRFRSKDKKPAYVPPALDDGDARPATTAEQQQQDYVTQPPKKQGLTGKISTLFRQKSVDAADTKPKATPRTRITTTTTTMSRTTPTSPHRQQQRSTSRGTSHRHSDDVSVGSRISQTKRIFYSSNQDDDSDDSYESRVSRASRASHRSKSRTRGGATSRREQDIYAHDSSTTGGHASMGTETTPGDSDYYYQSRDDEDTVHRFRGFSTSIRSLFLDEPLVCASMGCFGLLLSNRTEYLLDLRNQRRGTLNQQKNHRRLPSKVVSWGLLWTCLLMFATFLIWGFGSGSGESLAGDYVTGYDHFNDKSSNNGNYATDDQAYGMTDDANNNNNGEEEDQEEQWWDDYLQSNNENRYQGNYNNNGNDDYYNNAANDDGGNNYNNNDDYNNFYYNDDGGNNNNADDGNVANGDDYYNDDAAAAYDDYYNANNNNNDDYYNNNNRYLWVPLQHPEDSFGRSTQRHPLHGIFKLRDYHEHLWCPIAQAVSSEWNELQREQQHQRRRRMDDYGTYNYNTDDAAAQETTSQQQQGYSSRNIASDIRVALVFAFLLFLGVLGRRRRMRTRFYIVRARAQEDHLYYASSDQAAARRVAFDDTKEDQYEGACSHTLCGCYPIDEIEDNGESEQVKVTDTGIFRHKSKPHHEDSVARGFNCLMSICCGALCKCWFQCLSICAVAQEAREIRLLLPPRYQRIDYITHQPFYEYQKDVNNLRRGWMGRAERMSGIMPHYNALSRLSRYIVLVFVVCIVALVATLVFNPRAAFSWQDAVVLVATFLQAFLVLFFVHWIFHRSDLSLDAVIKFFAAGFLVAVPTSVFFEGLLVNIVLFGSYIMYYMAELAGGERFSNFVFDHFRLIWIIGELFNAYVVAAVTEELCKYYTFRAVEHPDLVFLTGLQREEQDETAVEGGLVKYPFASHQVEGFIKDNDAKSARRGKQSRKEHLLEQSGAADSEFEEDEKDVRTYRQKAMAITTGMISVAVGLACAENFMYVFVLGGALGGNAADGDEDHPTDVMEAWIVLFFRSIFPVHALAAAMQSINVIRKFVEHENHDGHRIGVGRIILPAIILHGTFDAILMGINVFVETAWDKYLEENEGNIGDGDPYNSIVLNLVAWISITVVMLIGLIWYYRENRNQRLRLILLEEREKTLVGVKGGARDWASGMKAKSNDKPSTAAGEFA